MLTKEDLIKIKQMKSLLNQAKFELKGDAVHAVSSLKLWFENLEPRLEESLKVKIGKDDPIKKVKK